VATRAGAEAAAIVQRQHCRPALPWYGYCNSDFYVAGTVLGSQALGSYTLAWNLSHVTDKLTALVLQITSPVLAKVQDGRAEMRRTSPDVRRQ
jgi:hypothetical protein